MAPPQGILDSETHLFIKYVFRFLSRFFPVLASKFDSDFETVEKNDKIFTHKSFEPKENICTLYIFKKIKKNRKFFHHFFTDTFFAWNLLQIFQRIRNRHPILNIFDAHLECLQKQYFRIM